MQLCDSSEELPSETYAIWLQGVPYNCDLWDKKAAHKINLSQQVKSVKSQREVCVCRGGSSITFPSYIKTLNSENAMCPNWEIAVYFECTT